MLACYLTWHLRRTWAPLTYADEHPPQRANPVAPARRSPSADAKAARKTGPGRQPIRSFRDLLTLTRNDLRYGQATIPALAEPTSTQRRAFDLIGTPIPITLGTAQTPQTPTSEHKPQLNPGSHYLGRRNFGLAPDGRARPASRP